MFCPSCGKEIPDSAKFCPMCGESFAADTQAPQAEAVPQPVSAVPEPAQTVPVQAPVQPVEAAQPVQAPVQLAKEQPAQTIPQYAPQAEAAAAPAAPAAKKFDISALLKNKNVLIGAAAVIAVILLIIIISVIAGSSTGGSAYNIVTTGYNYYREDDVIHVFYGAQQLEPIDAEGINNTVTSSNGSAMAMLTYDDELYYFKGASVEKIDEYESLQTLKISNDGSTVAFVDYDDGAYVFYTYSNGKLNEICEYENGHTYDSFVMSPNGSTILYTVYEDGDNVLYAYNGEEIEIGKDFSPVAVSDGGKVAYIYDDDSDKLCIIKNLDESTKETVDNEYYRLTALTTDATAILYRNEDGHTMMFSPDVKKPVLVEKNSIDLIFPANAVRTLDSFDNFLAKDEGTIRRYIRKGDEYKDENKILSDSKYSMYTISEDGSTIVFSDGDELCKIATKPGAKETVIYEDMGSYFFYADPTLSHIYFEDGDDNFCHSNGSKGNCKVVFTEDDAEDFVDGNLTAAGVMLLLNKDDTLYYIDGTSAKEVKKPSEIDSIIGIVGNTVFVKADDEIWVSKDGKSYTNTGIEME